MGRPNNFCLLFFAPMLLSIPVAEAQILGRAERLISEVGELKIQGWACDTGHAQSIQVHAYAGGPAGSGKLFSSADANLPGEAAVNEACQTPPGTNHRYLIPISAAQRQSLAGQAIHVHGIAVSGNGFENLEVEDFAEKLMIPPPDLAIDNSQKQPDGAVLAPVAVESAPTADTSIDGWIDQFNPQPDGSVQVIGWACQLGNGASIDLHIYAGKSASDPSGGGKILMGARAELPRGDVNSVCHTASGVAHGFNFTIPKEKVAANAGQKIFVHGIARASDNIENRAIHGSGEHSLPGAQLAIAGTGTAEPAREPASVGSAGFYQVTGEAAIFYSNGSDAYCGYPSWDRFADAGGKADLSNVKKLADKGYLNGLRYDGACAEGGRRLSELVATSGQDVTINEGERVILDQAPPIGLLQVKGELLCPSTGDFSLRVTGIQVVGPKALFRCGSPESRFNGNLMIEVNGGRTIMGAERSIDVFNGATLRLAGDGRNATWLRLAKTAEAGATEIHVSGETDWRVGDTVAIAPTGYNPAEAERAAITAVNGPMITLDRALAFRHYGGSEKFMHGPRSYDLDESAEVANLTRNIRIYAPGDGPSLDYRGVHVMVMATAKAYVDGIEIANGGRMGEMMRYPFHWHRMGDAEGQYIKNSSIHDSFQRCVTVHGTNKVVVENNVCFDHYGHGFFLEDGNETNNLFQNNLGILTRRPLPDRNLLQSDIDLGSQPRWAGPATFWISNPSNKFIGNVAAGSEGSGFWSAFADSLSCDSTACAVRSDGSGNVHPVKAAFGQFDNNVAHSAKVGMTWDGADHGPLLSNPRNPADRQVAAAHYAPATPPTVQGNKVYKMTGAGVYFRGNTFTFNNTVLADNRASIWVAYNQRFTNSAIIAMSKNHRASELDEDGAPRDGVWLYDGPLELINVDFFNFPSEPLMHNGRDFTPNPIRSAVGGAGRYTNHVRGLTFNPEPVRRILLSPDNWGDSRYNVSIRDDDGSLGAGAGIVVPDEPFNRDPSCQPMLKSMAFRCGGARGMLNLLEISPGANKYPYQVTRSDGGATPTLLELEGVPLFNKVGLNIGAPYEYFVNTGSRPNALNFYFSGETEGALSPVLRFQNFGNCSLVNVPRVGSAEEVKAATSAVYFTTGNETIMRLQANQVDGIGPGRTTLSGYSLSCP